MEILIILSDNSPAWREQRWSSSSQVPPTETGDSRESIQRADVI